MKKFAVSLLVFIMITAWFSVSEAQMVTLYSLDGRTIEVDISDKEAYEEVGWYEKVCVVYAPDGRSLNIDEEQLEDYKKVGWYENIESVQKTMYSADGRSVTVWMDEVSAYKKVGWYENKSEACKTMYSEDGRTVQVWLFEVPAYKKVGWFENLGDVTVDIASLSRKTLTIYKAQLNDYLKNGWYPKQPDIIDTSKPMVALTYDDGPAIDTTETILNSLELFNAKATFFVVGYMAKGKEDILQRMISLGCQIGNHTYSHPDLTKLSSKKIKSELNNTDNIISDATSISSTAVRPPYGAINQKVRSAVKKPMILWSVDTLDWKYKDADYVTDYVLSNVKDGDIILMHDIHSSTAKASETIIPELIKRGYQLVTVEELALYKGYELSAGNTYGKFR